MEPDVKLDSRLIQILTLKRPYFTNEHLVTKIAGLDDDCNI